ncbi:NAD(P)-binding protein [Panus rudis PR-1116 ss-1]|nr:NAD(P)-binding protein [Panus rudis PR-1116 ss-1]
MLQIPPVVTADLSGKTVLVTGANVGLGLETAKHFARMNPEKLVITCRSEEKGTNAIAEIQRETGFTRIQSRVLELSNFQQVVSFASQFKKENPVLHILVANAGVAMTKWERTPDNWETDLQVNHLSTALLALLLLPCLSQAARDSSSPSRLVVVSSGIHTQVSFSEDQFPSNIITRLNDQSLTDTAGFESRYGHTKLLNVLFTRALAERLVPTSGIVANTVNPGFCATQLMRHVEDKSLADQYSSLLRSPEEGSRALIFAAIARSNAGKEDIQQFQGAYISDVAQIASPSDWVLSEEGHRAQEKIWHETIEILSNVSTDIGEIVKKYTKQ